MERPIPRVLTSVVVQLLWVLGACDSGGLDSHRALVPARLAFTEPPSAVMAGAAIRPAVAVEVQDEHWKRVIDAHATVTVSLGTNSAGATLSGIVTAEAVNGRAVFSELSLDRSGTGYTLTANAAGLGEARSSPFNVSFAPVTLAFGVQPRTTQMAQPIVPAVTVAVLDREGNTVESASTSVTVGIGNNPWSGTLGGTLTVAVVNGVASFSGLTIDTAGKGYTLAASASGLDDARSEAFDIDMPDGGVPFEIEVFRLLDAARVHSLLATSQFFFLLNPDDTIWGDWDCFVVSVDGQPPPPVLPTGSHTYAVTYDDLCIIDPQAGWALGGTASAAYTSADLNDLTARVSVNSMRGQLINYYSDMLEVLADGSGLWTRVRTGPGYSASTKVTATYTPTIGSTLVYSNVATFEGGSYQFSYGPIPPGYSQQAHDGFDHLGIAINGVSYTLDGSLDVLYAFDASKNLWKGEVRITSNGTPMARVYGDPNGVLRAEAFRRLIPL